MVMTRDEITHMAREAGMERIVAIAFDGTQTVEMARFELLDRFAALVAAHVRETEFKPDWTNYWQGRIDGAADEREACARLAEEQPTFTRYAEEVLEDVVKLIRARGDA